MHAKFWIYAGECLLVLLLFSPAPVRAGIVNGDFEQGSWNGWKVVSGTAWGSAPHAGNNWQARAERESRDHPMRVAGKFYAVSARDNGDPHREEEAGVLRSDAFEITRPILEFRLAGYNANNLVEVKRASDGTKLGGLAALWGFDGFLQRQINLKDYVGEKAYIEVVDQGPGWIAVDEFRFADPAPKTLSVFQSPLHYRMPGGARFADAIPFAWKGEYHIFYLAGVQPGTTIEHLKSTDLINWQEMPTAIPVGKSDEPDGVNVFNGSIIEHEGTFHFFYTGFNPNHPGGREQTMHATSRDLIHWTKHPEDTFGPDNVHYRHSSDGADAFRDPYVIWDEKRQEWLMFFAAQDIRAKGPQQGPDAGNVMGLATSKDLKRWKQIEPLLTDVGGPPEAPDVFKIDDTYYLIYAPWSTPRYRYAKDLRGPWLKPAYETIDPTIYVPKRMYDGKRHILAGWIGDNDDRWDGRWRAWSWGGSGSLPREVYEIQDGQLGVRPASEVVAQFVRPALNLATKPRLLVASGQWDYKTAPLFGQGDIRESEGSLQASGYGAAQVGKGGLVGDPRGAAFAHCTFEVPADYMLDCLVELEAQATFTLDLREKDGPTQAFRIMIKPSANKVELVVPEGSNVGGSFPLDVSKPIRIQAFVEGDIIEWFINDTYSFAARAYTYDQGKLGLTVSGGRAKVTALSLKESSYRIKRMEMKLR